jgi:hypothetical protein
MKEAEQQWRRSQGKSKTGGETPVQFSHKTFQHIKFSLVHTQHWDGYGKGICVETIACAFIEARPVYLFLS